MKSTLFATVLTVFAATIAHADTQGTPSAADAKVFIIAPKDGAEVSSPVMVKFGITGMELAPAGTDKPNSGHHHLIIDAKTTDVTAAIPADANHVHFGKGQTEASVELKPGPHTLQLILGDKNHVPHTPPVVSSVVTITVK